MRGHYACHPPSCKTLKDRMWLPHPNFLQRVAPQSAQIPQPQVVDFRRSHSSRTTSESSNDSEKSGDYGSGGENHCSDSEEQLPDYGGDFGEGQSASEGSSACSNAGNDLERVLAQPTHNLSMGQGAENASVKREPKKLRRRFGPDEDYMLAIQVNADEPFNAKHGEVGKCWDILADKLNKSVNFNMRAIKGTTAKTRFEAILEKHNTWDKKSNGKSGVNERDNNYVQLMTELATKVSDHADEAAKEKERRQ
ncbi:hypothetical protein ON010_g10672 [Phytophthora cinnamomi]|nr:hypothetical protein ON010_g10672 [Phytophthora cinnamomi]